jgi:hypothetical protein
MEKLYTAVLSDVDLKALQRKWAGGEFRSLVAHLMTLGDGLRETLQSEMSAFDAVEAEAAAEITKEFLDLAHDQCFWSRDAGQVLAQVTTRFEEEMSARGRSTDVGTKFNMFQSLGHGFALTALVNPSFRKFIGV